jgi:hypothetical protein
MKLLNFAIATMCAAAAFVTSVAIASGAKPANALYLGIIFANVVIASVNIVLAST